MEIQNALEYQWPYLLSFLPAGVDLEETAYASGALRRKREIRSAETLLRLALAYGVCGMSLREVAAWAQVSKLANISDVALLKRLRSCAPWLGFLLGRKLAQLAEPLPEAAQLHNVCLVDATVVSIPQNARIQWRIHLRFDLLRQAIVSCELSKTDVGETFVRHTPRPGELVMGDRGYAQRRGLVHLVEHGADFLVRLNLKSVPLMTHDGRAFDLLGALRSLPEAQAGEFFLRTVPTQELPSLDVRLLALRKSEPLAEAGRKKILRDYSKKGRRIDANTLEAASYVFVLTSLPASRIRAVDALALYRFRWQIELAFKRLKSLLHLDVLLAYDERLAQTTLYAKLLAALLLDDLTTKFVDFSPWGFCFPNLTTLYLAPPQSPH
jgi:hypothetical protein